MYLKINPFHPENKKIMKAVDTLKEGGVIIYPTDTVYGLGCDIFSAKAIKKIYQIKKRDKNKPLSIICQDFKQIADYAIVEDYAFRLMKKTLPGPYTFILKAKNKMPKSFISKNKTVGVRIPDNTICQELVKNLGSPIITTSLNISEEAVLTDPSNLSKEMANKIDLIIDIGPLPQEASSVIDLSQPTPQILRQGKGDISLFQ